LTPYKNLLQFYLQSEKLHLESPTIELPIAHSTSKAAQAIAIVSSLAIICQACLRSAWRHHNARRDTSTSKKENSHLVQSARLSLASPLRIETRHPNETTLSLTSKENFPTCLLPCFDSFFITLVFHLIQEHSKYRPFTIQK
jgi:hypothetical protein